MKLQLTLLATAAMIGSASIAWSQSAGGPYEVTKHTIDNGGQRSEGGDFTLTGTIGQADAAPAATGGNFSLQSGFWTAKPSGPLDELMFSDGFEALN